ncbi:RNA polymerase sigma factor RpoD/SigA [Nonomuraea wenchangensis]
MTYCRERRAVGLSPERLIQRCIEVLLEDVERIGSLPRAHVTSVASKRGLDAVQLVDVLTALASMGVLQEESVSYGDGSSPRSDESAGTGGEEGPVFMPEFPSRMAKHVVLTASQEVSLARRIQMGIKATEHASGASIEVPSAIREVISDGLAAKRELISHNIKLAMSIVRAYVNPISGKTHVGDLTFDDLVQEAVVGLNRAAEKFNPALGNKFSTYASWWIKQAVTRAIENTATTIRIPVHVWDEWKRVDKYTREYEVRNGRPPTVSELADAIGKKPEHVRALLDYMAPIVRLDAPVADEEDASSLGELILRDPYSGMDEEVIKSLLLSQLREHLGAIAKDYDPRFMAILVGRFGLDGAEEMTLEELGKQLGITRERVRQLEKKILQRLRCDKTLRRLGRDYWEVA